MKHQKVRDALAAGPTPGPWEIIGESSALWAKTGCIAKVTMWINSREAAEANARYLATVDPDTLRALLADADRADALEKALRRAVWALAAASERDPSFKRDYEIASSALSQGEQT